MMQTVFFHYHTDIMLCSEEKTTCGCDDDDASRNCCGERRCVMSIFVRSLCNRFYNCSGAEKRSMYRTYNTSTRVGNVNNNMHVSDYFIGYVTKT